MQWTYITVVLSLFISAVIHGYRRCTGARAGVYRGRKLIDYYRGDSQQSGHVRDLCKTTHCPLKIRLVD